MRLSAIRRHVNYANGAATVALVFAMSGGAFAAVSDAGGQRAHVAKHKAKTGSYVITSTKQIKPSVLGALKGAAGPAGPAGEKGAPGAAGTNGKDGVEGKSGSNGTDGSDGTSATTTPFAGAEHGCTVGGVEVKSASPAAYVCNGQTGFTETLPESKAEKGAWATTSIAGSTFSPPEASISYTIPLSAAPTHMDLIGEGEGQGEGKEAPAIQNGECSGTAEEPEAAPGNLCVFVFTYENVKESGKGGFVLTPAGAQAGKVGAIIALFPETEGKLLRAYGSWAVKEAVGA